MSVDSTKQRTRGMPRSVGSVIAGLIAVFILSLGTDQVLHVAGVFPPWGERMSDALFLLATAYRTIYNVAGGYITARLAPDRPMAHALALGLVGLVLSLIGLTVSLAHPELGPLWYSVVIAAEAVPCPWLGGRLYAGRAQGRTGR
jgi:hypothetical protein